MTKNKIIKIGIIIAVIYVVSLVLAILAFNAVQKSNSTPTDEAVRSYFYTDEAFLSEYETIYSIARNRRYDIIEEENIIKVAYNVESSKMDFVMYVTLEKQNDELIVLSYEIVKELV